MSRVSRPLHGHSPARGTVTHRLVAPILGPVLGLIAGTMLAAGSAAAQAPARRSGFEDMTAATQALQRDDSQNPAMLWVAEGEARWREAAGAARKSCQDCHGEASQSLRGVATRYPAHDARLGRTLSLAQRVAHCRSQHQKVPISAAGSADAELELALLVFVARQSRGMAIAPPPQPELAPVQRAGERLWQQPLGQLGLSCASCHDRLAGRRLAGSLIPQGHPTGYPLYRLEWQAVGSLLRRLRNCVVGVRAEPFAPDAPEWVQLEAYLMQRAAGMPLETPAVRP